ncbi:hypothetical protein B0H10DRAFT_2021813 [Mycena sp. CBHHK59/15]|nr:hypothetical protein B0H10DRAFT_2021813 [Mycena sp. CBHHK59/15]
MPQLVFKPGVITHEGGQISEDRAANTWTTRTCDFADCENYEKLNKCARCKTAMYCSKTCQKSDWPNHKVMCRLATQFPPPAVGGDLEPALRRHIRLWTARFNGSLVCATIVALELNKHPENIDKVGLVITVYPRPHPEAGSRFNLVSAIVTPMGAMENIMALQDKQATSQNTGPTVIEVHKQQREALKKRSGGQEDFATVIVIAKNLGPHALPGIEYDTEIRFKPIGVHRKMVRSAQLTDPTLDWYSTLKFQIERDIPNRQMVGGSGQA